MNRFSLVAIAFALVPTMARGQQPMPRPTTAAPAVVKAMPVSCAPTLMEPLSVMPTVPPPGPCGAACSGCEKRSLFQSLLNCFRKPTAADTCTTGPACPAPVRIKLTKPCVTAACPTTTCPAPVGPTCAKATHAVARPCAGGACWDRLKTWFCWKPCGEQLLPILCPEPYHAPLYTYFPKCEEPTPGIPCATGPCKHGKKCATGSCPPNACAMGACPTGGCPTAVGPVVSPWVYMGAAMPMPAPQPVAGPVVPQPANLLARPFTSP